MLSFRGLLVGCLLGFSSGLLFADTPSGGIRGSVATDPGAAENIYSSNHALYSFGQLLACEDQTLSSCWTSFGSSTVNVTQAVTSTQVKASPGEITGFFVNSMTAGTIRFSDQVSGTCNAAFKGGTITPTVIGYNPYPAKFATGICALTGGTAVDVTIFYR